MRYRFTPIYLLIAAMLGAAPVAQAQSELRKANKHYENYEFALALDQYKAAIAKRQPDAQTTQRIADAYRLTRRTSEAEVWYAKVVALPGRDPMSLYHYAEALRSNGKYDEAKAQYMLWADEMPQMEERAQQLMQACDKSMKWMTQLPVAEVTRLQSINTANFADFSPMSYGNGIIFTSDRGLRGDSKTDIYGWTGRPYLQLYTADKDMNGNWGAPVALQDVQTSQYHNATASAAEDGGMLYFTRTQMVKKRETGDIDPTSWVKDKEEVKEYVNRLEIYSAKRQGSNLSNIQPFAFNKVEEYSVGHPALSPDGKLLYFVSDMPGGKGETDIYFVERQANGSWSEPKNAGHVINTSGRESFPYVDKNGKLFFASDGHIGMGGLDIFSAEGNHAAWTTVKNLGHPINSPQNDYGIMYDKAGETGLLSSNRDAADGTEDIFSFTMLQKPVVLAITTLERKQNEKKRNIQVPLPQVSITVSQQNLNDSVMVMSDEGGKYFMDGRMGNTYSFLGSKDGYLKQSVQAKVPDTAPDTVHVALLFDRNEVNKAIVLENIYYDLDKWDIRPDAAKELDKLVTVLETNPKIKIEMSAHTDSRESVNYNQQLSERRAQAAVDYLVSKGIDRNRLTAKGYGKTRLRNGCTDGVQCSEEEHQLNRRTEFKIK
ncbi:OmpA family protein [Pontibacter ruber]|uniref:OmpA family protein n=1 Tax=Pontibacter ruber TaxID=1343895 RepID=A0ABW5D116_9BACT|nr:OmpA family protein [Pontibacter ruber]